jgi:hypothetical protein
MFLSAKGRIDEYLYANIMLRTTPASGKAQLSQISSKFFDRGSKKPTTRASLWLIK